MADQPILLLDQVTKEYRAKGLFHRPVTFSLQAHLEFRGPEVVGMMGPNGAGKTTLFELMTGNNTPTQGRVLCMGQDMQRVRYGQRDRLAIHYHQSYQVRKHKRRLPSWMLEPAKSDSPMVHLFDEPQFNTQDGYIGFMLDFFRKLRANGRLVFICLHPTAPYHLRILEELCERFLFVQKGQVTSAPTLAALVEQPPARDYLDKLVLPGA